MIAEPYPENIGVSAMTIWAPEDFRGDLEIMWWYPGKSADSLLVVAKAMVNGSQTAFRNCLIGALTSKATDPNTKTTKRMRAR